MYSNTNSRRCKAPRALSPVPENQRPPPYMFDGAASSGRDTMNYNADSSQRAIAPKAQVDRRRHGAMRDFRTALGRAIMRSLEHDQEIKEVFTTGI